MQKVEGSSPFSRSLEKPCYSQGFFVSEIRFEGVWELGRTNRADQSASWREPVLLESVALGTVVHAGRVDRRRDRTSRVKPAVGSVNGPLNEVMVVAPLLPQAVEAA